MRGDSGAGTHQGLNDPGKQARLSSGIPVVPAFDGFRALAIFGVVALHLLNLSGVVESGDSGFLAKLTWGTVGHTIDVLFIVSGFVVFLPTVAREGKFGSVYGYAIRRAARLLPAYWAVLVICILLILLTSITPDINDPSFRDIGLHLFGIQTPAGLVLPDVSVGLGLDPPLWTLSVEIGFYIVLPLIAALYFRHPLAGLIAAGLITVAWNLAFRNIGDVSSALGFDVAGFEQIRLAAASSLQLPSWAFSFGLGMTGAWAYVRWHQAARTERGRVVVGWLTLAALSGFIAMAWWAGSYSDDAAFDIVAQFSRFTAGIAIGYSGFLAALMVLIAMGAPLVQWPFSNGPIRKLGDISYGVYLIHFVIAVYAGSVLGLPDDGSIQALAVWTVAVLPASLLYGYLSARYLEQPIRRWARRYGNRHTASTPAAK